MAVGTVATTSEPLQHDYCGRDGPIRAHTPGQLTGATHFRIFFNDSTADRGLEALFDSRSIADGSWMSPTLDRQVMSQLHTTSYRDSRGPYRTLSL